MATAAKPATRSSRATVARRARAQHDTRQLEQTMRSLEAAQKDLAAIGGSVGTGVRDLRRDVGKLLRDARRDLLKMRRAMQRDLERLQKDLSAAAMAKPAPARRARKPSSSSTSPRRRAASAR